VWNGWLRWSSTWSATSWSQARASASVLKIRAGRLAGEMLTNRRKAERACSFRPMTASGPLFSVAV
jgi:hypothetical protein